MNTVIFDIGGTLRTIRTPNCPKHISKRNYTATRQLYRTLHASQEWKVIILTASAHSEKSIRLDIELMDLPEPNELHIVSRQEDKAPMFKKLSPALVIDDNVSVCCAAPFRAPCVSLNVI